MGGAIAGAVALAALDPLVGTVASQLSAAAALAPVSAVSSGLLGTAAGLLQWAVLRRRSSATVWWIAATAGGWAAGGAIAGTLGGFLSGTVTHVGLGMGVQGYLLGLVGGVVAVGLVPGVLQSLVLRHHVDSLTWSVTHLIALGAGFLVAFPVMLVVATLLRWSLPSLEAWAVAGLLMGTVFGILTWRVLERALATRA